MWSVLASCVSVRSPTPVPASISTASSTRNDVVRRLPPMPPLHPNTLIFIVCPTATPAAWLRLSVPWLRSRWRTDSRSIIGRNERGCCGAFHSLRDSRGRRQTPLRDRLAPSGGSRLVEKLHLDARDLDQVVVAQRARLGAERGAVQGRVGRALYVGDEVAVGALGDDRHLQARLADRGEVLGEVQGAPGGGPGEHLDRGLAQRRRAGGGARCGARRGRRRRGRSRGGGRRRRWRRGRMRGGRCRRRSGRGRRGRR